MKINVYSSSKEEEKEDRKTLTLIKYAMRLGADCKEEIFGYLMYRYYNSIRRATQLEFGPALKRILPEIIDALDKRAEAGEEICVAADAEEFLLEMGNGDRKYLNLGPARFAGSVRKSLHYDGLNIKCQTKYIDGAAKKYFLFKALTEDEARAIEKQDEKNQRKAACKRIAKEVCHHQVYDEDENSIWGNAKFIKEIGGCAFDVRKLEEKVEKEKEKLLNYNLKNGLRLLFEGYD